LLEYIIWDSFELEKASRVSRYSSPDTYALYARSYYVPFWHDLYNSSNHDLNWCPYYVCYAQLDFASLRDNTDVVMTFADSSFPLALFTRLKMGNLLGLLLGIVLLMHV